MLHLLVSTRIVSKGIGIGSHIGSYVGSRCIRTAAFRLNLDHTILSAPLPRSLHSLSKRYLQVPRSVSSSVMSSYTKEPIASSTAHTGKLASIDLSGYNFEQAKLMDERCIVVDENDNPLGALDKKTCGSLRLAVFLSQG